MCFDHPRMLTYLLDTGSLWDSMFINGAYKKPSYVIQSVIFMFIYKKNITVEHNSTVSTHT